MSMFGSLEGIGGYSLEGGRHGLEGISKIDLSYNEKICKQSPVKELKECISRISEGVTSNRKGDCISHLEILQKGFKNPALLVDDLEQYTFKNDLFRIANRNSCKSLDETCKVFAEVCGLEKKYMPSIARQIASTQEIEQAAKNGSKIAKAVLKENALCKAKAFGDTVSDSFKGSGKSAKESAQVFQEAYKQQLLAEAQLRNAKPNLALRKTIDKSFKGSGKSAKKSAQVFQEAYKQQLLAEAKLRNKKPNLVLRDAIDTSFKGSGKSAQESAKVFQDMYAETAKRYAQRTAKPDTTLLDNINKNVIKGGKANKSARASAEVFENAHKGFKGKIKEFFYSGYGRKAIDFVKNNKMAIGITAAIGVVLYELLPSKKQDVIIQQASMPQTITSSGNTTIQW